jgi:quercetin dioxygenase-like cupin family protein
MLRNLLSLAVGIGVGAGGMFAVERVGQRVKTIAEREIVETLDGKKAKETVVEVSFEPGGAGEAHRHPGPVFGYVLEGEYELGIDDKPSKVLKQGDTFYEPTGCLHRVSKNASGTKRTRVLAVVLQPRDAKALVIPEGKKE